MKDKLMVLVDILNKSQLHLSFDMDEGNFNFLNIENGIRYEIGINEDEEFLAVIYNGNLNVDVVYDDLDKYINLLTIQTNEYLTKAQYSGLNIENKASRKKSSYEL